jgi:hypothetical protein
LPQPDPSGVQPTLRRRSSGTPLDRLLALAADPESVTRTDLDLGDTVVITTRNSTYALCTAGNDRFAVTGGWFEHNGGSPQMAQVNGCTWGGSAIRHDLVAAPGLFLEFANGVRTTRIHSVRVIHAGMDGQAH